MLRIPENLAKTDRVIRIYGNEVIDTPDLVVEVLKAQKERLLEAQKKYGDYISPFDLE